MTNSRTTRNPAGASRRYLRLQALTLVVVCLILVAPAATTQTTVDVNGQLYTDLHYWLDHGLIEKLPALRPYSIQLVRSALEDVVARGNRDDQRRARRYLESLSGLTWGPSHTSRFADGLYYGHTAPSVRVHSTIMPRLTLGFALDIYLIDRADGTLVPAGTREPIDYHEDWSDFDLFGVNYKVRQGFRSMLSYGTADFYVQAGNARLDHGPFGGNGVVFGGQAPHVPQFSLTWSRERLVVQMLYAELTATNYLGGGRAPGKHLYYNGIQWWPLDWLELAAFETVVFGPRFDLTYFVPFAYLFYQQAFSGFDDNSLAGVSAYARLPYGLVPGVVLFMDDVHFNDIVRFDFETKYKIAAEVGVDWLPQVPVLSRVGVDYTMVAPYTYSHVDERFSGDTPSSPNESNYTHAGVNLGPALHPNSDRSTVGVELRPTSFTDVELMARFIRHGNASEGITDGDGTIWDDGYDDSGRPTFQNETRFLTQEVLEQTLQVGTRLRAAVPQIPGSATVGLGITGEWVWNAGLVEGDRDRTLYVELDMAYRY